MNCFPRSVQSWVRRVASLSSFLIIINIAAVLSCITATNIVGAAPVTFQFSGTIKTIYPAIPFDAGIEFALGDMISGEFSFDPAAGDGSKSFSAVQQYNFFLNINGVALVAPSFGIEAIDNVLVVSDCPPGVDCFSGVADVLMIGGSGLASVENGPALGLLPDLSSFRMDLYGLPHLLSQGSVPPEPTVWNEFDIVRQINVSIRNSNGGTMGFQAMISDFAAIPEPSLVALGSCAMIVISFNRRWYLSKACRGEK